MPRCFLNIFCGNRGPPTLHFVPVGTPIPTLDSLGRDSDLSEENVGTEALAERRSRPRIRCEYSIFERRDCQTLVKKMSRKCQAENRENWRENTRNARLCH